MTEGALSDLRIMEHADPISGPFCGKLMADLGAEVIKVEPPAGDSARKSGPFPNDIPHPEKSGLFLYLNTNKLGVTLNLQSNAGARLFRQLVGQADILIESNLPLLESLGLGYEALAQINPRLITTCISPFGQSGPYRDFEATNLVTMHMGGVAYYTPGAAENPEAESPLKGGGHQGDFLAGMMAALVTLSGVFTGAGQQIDLSQYEAVAFTLLRDIAGYSYEGTVPSRLKSKVRGFGNSLPCKDGYVQIYAADDRQWRGLMEAIGNPDWAKDKRYQTSASRTANWETLEPRLAEWTKQRGKEEVYQAVQPRHAACAPVNTIAEVLRSTQLASREYFVDIVHPDTGRLKYPGPPARFSGTPWRVARPAPRLGEHNEEVFCQRLGCSREELVRMRQAGVV